MESTIEVSNLIDPVIKAYRLLSNEWKHLMDIGIAEYLNSQTEKFYYTNTFIHRSEKVRFYDVYYPLKATNNRDLITDFSNLHEIFDERKSITFIGSAGSGKSTLMRYIFLETIKNKDRIPILIELRNLNEYQGDLDKLITEKILKSRIKPSDDTLRRTLTSGRFLFLLDGYDEIFSNKKQEINRQIELFVDAYSNNQFLITSRPGSGIEAFPRFHNFYVEGLERADVDQFIDKIVTNAERKDRIKKILRAPGNSSYHEYLSNPLLLSMFIMAFESHPEIPSRKSAFYRNVFDTLYSRHDGITKNSFPREKLTKLQREEFEQVLNIFSYLTITRGEYAFTYESLTDTLERVKKATGFNFRTEDMISDLQTALSILVQDGLEYKFPHRSMQEYFTAQFLTSLPPDKKAKAYKNFLLIFNKDESFDSFGIWDLCQELDFIYFTSGFMVPQLRYYLSELNYENDRTLVLSFFELIGAVIDYYPGEKDRVIIFTDLGMFTSIIAFYSIYNEDVLNFFPQHAGITNELLGVLATIRDTLPFYLGEDDYPEITDILMNTKIADKIKTFISDIEDTIVALEEEVNQQKSNIDDILGI